MAQLAPLSMSKNDRYLSDTGGNLPEYQSPGSNAGMWGLCHTCSPFESLGSMHECLGVDVTGAKYLESYPGRKALRNMVSQFHPDSTVWQASPCSLNPVEIRTTDISVAAAI